MIGRRGLLLAAAAAGSASAQSARPLTLVSGGPAGSAVDIAVRSFAPFLERYLPRHRVAVENRPGAAGVAAYRAVGNAGADGSMLGWVSTPALPARCVELADPTLAGRLVLLGAVSKEPIALVAPASGPLRTTADLLNIAATEPVAVTGPGSPAHLAALRLQHETGIVLDLVSFPSGGAVRQATSAGNVAAGILPLSEAAPGLRDGKLVPLGVASLKAEAFPDWPTFADQGIRLSAWIHRGLAAPAGMSPTLMTKLATALQSVVADPEFTAQSDSDGVLPTFVTGEAWTARLRAEHEEIARLWSAQPWRRGSATG